MKTKVEYYMKGESKQSKTLDSFKEAQVFMEALSTNPDCEAYGIVRNAS